MLTVHHIAMRCDDIDTVAAFYESVFLAKRCGGTEGYSVWLKMNPGVLMLERRRSSEPTVLHSKELLAFEVSELDKEELRRRLAALNIRIEEETEHTLYFRDPEGRRLGASSYPF